MSPFSETATPTLVAERIRNSVVHDVLRTIADPWKPGIVLLLWRGERRFTALLRELGIARSTLTQRLQHLIDDGCVVRDDTGYALTAKGEGLLGLFVLNRQWNARWGHEVLLPHVPLAHACGAPLQARLVCAHCRQEVFARDVKVLGAAPGASGASAAAPAPDYRRARMRSQREGDAVRGEELASDRWTSLVLAAAFLGLRRNSEFEQALAIAPNILADRLAFLSRAGIFDRVQYQSAPERFEYRLTAKGLDRYPVILAMMDWGQRWGAAGQPRQDWGLLHKPCHEWLQPRLACAACNGEVDAHSTRPGVGGGTG